MSKGLFDMECGLSIAMPIEGEGRIRSGKLPGGKVITAMHIGPYEALAGDL
jgi:effector-binding domain-containing protein